MISLYFKSIIIGYGDPSLRFGMTTLFGGLGGKEWRFVENFKF